MPPVPDQVSGRGAARFVQAGEVGGQGRIVEAAAVEPSIEAAQGSGIGSAGVLAEGGPGELAGGFPDGQVAGCGCDGNDLAHGVLPSALRLTTERRIDEMLGALQPGDPASLDTGNRAVIIDTWP